LETISGDNEVMPTWLLITLQASTIIAMLTAPALAEIVKLRINRPKRTPDPNHPKKRTFRVIDRVIIFNICTLLSSMRYHETPVTVETIFAISSSFALISLCLAWMFILIVYEYAKGVSASLTEGLDGVSASLIETLNIIAAPISKQSVPADENQQRTPQKAN
jgi:hypothetical protein